MKMCFIKILLHMFYVITNRKHIYITLYYIIYTLYYVYTHNLYIRSYETAGMHSQFLAIIAFLWHFILRWEEFLLVYFVMYLFIYDFISSNHSTTGWE